MYAKTRSQITDKRRFRGLPIQLKYAVILTLSVSFTSLIMIFAMAWFLQRNYNLFMGDELGTSAPFLYFCDFEGDLARAVREGRRREFAAFERFRDPAARVAIPDPNDPATFLASKLPWEDLALEEARGWLALWKHLFAVRAREIAPRLADASIPASFRIVGETGLEADWTFADGARLHLRANVGPRPVHALRSALGRTLHEAGRRLDPIGGFAPWSGAWTLEERAR